MASYIAIVHKDEDSDYGVSFPDFPGCITAGSTLDEARAMAQEALEVHTDFMLKEGQELPAPMTMDAAVKEAFPEGLFATMVVSLDGERSKVARVNITLPARDLARIDRYAASHGMSRSAFLVQAARQVIQRGA
jgi:predicted RNase H-like HicB family nuclease